MKKLLMISLQLVSLNSYSSSLYDSFPECNRIDTQYDCDRKSEYAVERISCYKRITTDHRNCRDRVTQKITREKSVLKDKEIGQKNDIKNRAWAIIENKYQNNYNQTANEEQKRALDKITLGQKLKAYNSALIRQVVLPTEKLRDRISKHIKSSLMLNEKLASSPDVYKKNLNQFFDENKKLQSEVGKIVNNFESYYQHYLSEVNKLSQFEINKTYFTSVLEESRTVAKEPFDMKSALDNLNLRFSEVEAKIQNRSSGNELIKRGEFIALELYKARKDLKEANGEEKETILTKIELLQKYCLIEFSNNAKMCLEYEG